jgi:hypothetical protein
VRGFVRCKSCGRALTRSWSRGRGHSISEVPLRKGAAGAGLQIALEVDSSLFVGELDDDVELPGAVAGGMGHRPAL